MKSVISRLSALALVLFFAMPLRAQGGSPSPMSVTVENRTAQAEASRGTARRDDRVRPGDVLRYRLAFRNPGTGPVRGVTLANPLAGGMRLVEASARSSRADARVEFSADGGQTFAAQPTEMVTDAQGQRVRRPIPAERFTHVRWTVDGQVAPGATVTAEFDARVAGAPAPAARP